MGKAGRKRKQGKREPNGKLSRKAEHVQERRTLDEEAEMSVAKAARVRVNDVAPEHAGTDLAASVVGRLYLKGELEPELLNAARLLSDAYASYQRAVDSPRPPKAMAMGEASGPVPHDMPPELAYRARSQWGRIVALLGGENCTRRSSTIYAACYYVVLRDLNLPHLFGDMRLGLNAIGQAYGLVEKAA